MKAILKYIITPLVLILALLIFIFGTPYAFAAPTEKNILILHRFSAEFPAHKLFNKGIIKEIENECHYKVRYFYEYLNMDRYSDDQAYLKATAEYLKLKHNYSNWTPDVIIASDGAADFLAKYGDEIFGDVPIIAVWAGDGNAPTELPSKHVIISALANFDKNISLIRDTKKNLKKLYVVIGDSESEQRALVQIKQEAEPYKKQIEFAYLNKLTYQEMLDTLQLAGENSAILFVRWITDVKGKPFMPVRVLDEIMREVKVPVFGTQRQYLGSGIVGGYLYDLALISQNAAQMAIRIIHGETPRSETITGEQSHQYSFDWRALKRWDIDQNMLPNRRSIEYRNEGLWDLYGKYFIATGLVVLIETLLLIGQFRSRRRRRKAEDELSRLNTSLEKLVDARTQELQKAKNRLEELNKELDFSSRIDALTGLYNRRHMQERLDEEYQAFIRTGQFFSIMIVDIDDFKKVNDNYGHDVGDVVLKTISNLFRAAIRGYDVAARWGGEEFLLLYQEW